MKTFTAVKIKETVGKRIWKVSKIRYVVQQITSIRIPSSEPCIMFIILVPRGRAPFGQHQESRPLVSSNDIPVLNGFVNTIDWDQYQSDLSVLTQSMRRVIGSPWIADFRCWTRPEVAILGADQKERGLWGREWMFISIRVLRVRSTD